MSRPSLSPGRKLTYAPGPSGMSTPPSGPSLAAVSGVDKSRRPVYGTL